MHFEIPADNVERAQKFYSKVFGWKINPMPEMDYTILQTVDLDQKTMMPKEVGAINGGMFKRKESDDSVMVTIGVDDIDQALKGIEKAGGKTVTKKTSVGDMGFTAYFKDTEGNIVGLWQNAEE